MEPEPKQSTDVVYDALELNRIIDMGRKASLDGLQNWFDNALVQLCETLNKAPNDTALVQTSVINFTSWLNRNRVKLNYKLIESDWYFTWTVFDSVISTLYRLKYISTVENLEWKRRLLGASNRLCPPGLKKASMNNITSEIKRLGGFV